MEPELSTDYRKRQTIESLYQTSKQHFPEVPEVVPEELQALRDNGRVLLVDVRRPDEQAVSMLPGAVTKKEFEQRSEEFEGVTVVTYCTLGHRSGLYAKRLQAKGWRVHNLKGSILAWTHAGGELVDAEGPTQRVHVCGPSWNLAADGYEPVW